MAAVELLVVGNEILSGATLDTNSQWMARRLTTLGADVTRRTTVADLPEQIGEAVRAALARGAAMLLVTGGLGPTFDDITLQAVGAALGRPVAERPDALAFVAGRYRDLCDAGVVETADLLPGRRKMAAVPADAELIHNGVGTAPGVVLEADGQYVLCFPGVPRELYAMFDEPNVQTLFRDVLGARCVREAEVETPFNDESVLGPLCDEVMQRVPGAYLKSRASHFDHTTQIPVLITCAGPDPAEVEQRLARARDMLVDLCDLPAGAEGERRAPAE